MQFVEILEALHFAVQLVVTIEMKNKEKRELKDTLIENHFRVNSDHSRLIINLDMEDLFPIPVILEICTVGAICDL